LDPACYETAYDALVEVVLSIVKLPDGADVAKCQVDVENLFPFISDVVQDLENLRIDRLLIDLLSVIELVKNTAKDCLNKDLLESDIEKAI